MEYAYAVVKYILSMEEQHRLEIILLLWNWWNERNKMSYKHTNELGEWPLSPCDQRISTTRRVAAIAKGSSTNMNQKVAASSPSSLSL